MIADAFSIAELQTRGKLLSELARLTVERKYGRLEWSVLDWNTRAWDFYRSLGAGSKDEWTGARLTGDALVALSRKDK